jgi:hypothetical protein
MNVNTLKNKKSLKIITLLVSALMISTASATIYNYLNLSAGVGVEGLTLAWNNTSLDSGLSATIAGATCTLNGLMGPAGGTRTYSNAIKLTSTAATTFDIQVVSVTTTGGAGIDNLDSIVVNIYDESDVEQGTLTVFSGGSAGTTPVKNLGMTDAVTWRLEWIITWKTTAVAGTDTITVSLKVTTPTVP